MSNLALLTIGIYFLLNLVVTLTNKQVVSETSCPYLLTATHVLCTLITTDLISSFSNKPIDHPERTWRTRFTTLSFQAHTILVCFSLLYTINIAISNLSLGLISLSLHQTIRATAPAITVLLSITLLRRPLSSYSLSTYLSLVPIIAGVIFATTLPTLDDSASHGQETPSFNGIIITLSGAVLAVLKTILTNTLQSKRTPPRTARPASSLDLSLNLSPTTLIRYTAPFAVIQALLLAWWAGEIPRLHRVIVRNLGNAIPAATNGRVLAITAINVFAAGMLNIASFEANRRCGPLAMAVVANLKQVMILIIALWVKDDDGGCGWRVVLGALMTVVGGAWFACAQWKGERGEKDRESIPR
ncbi:hypothetical protein LTR84_003667 [Exophiala bonariae]|uniref:Sugar phosphate transporter domain-containing protein n=1 Tax=Exophiala bonariae TaxID=1690606 RepID=A0AAV9NAG0_9EURO|nr:hypothetical protein LTR84_003667 [Exophiala bonariae]